MTAYILLGNKDQYDLEAIQEIIDRIYPADSCDLTGLVDDRIAELASSKGFLIEAYDGDQYEQNQWLKVSANFEIQEPDGDSEQEWEWFDFLREERYRAEEIGTAKFIAALRSAL